MTTQDFTKYVVVTPDGNVGIRGSVEEPFFFETSHPDWKNDGFPPDVARKFAQAILTAATAAENRPVYPEYWPPREGDIWNQVGSITNVNYLIAHVLQERLGGRTRPMWRVVHAVSGTTTVRDLDSEVRDDRFEWTLIYRQGVKP